MRIQVLLTSFHHLHLPHSSRWPHLLPHRDYQGHQTQSFPTFSHRNNVQSLLFPPGPLQANLSACPDTRHALQAPIPAGLLSALLTGAAEQTFAVFVPSTPTLTLVLFLPHQSVLKSNCRVHQCHPNCQPMTSLLSIL